MSGVLSVCFCIVCVDFVVCGLLLCVCGLFHIVCRFMWCCGFYSVYFYSVYNIIDCSFIIMCILIFIVHFLLFVCAATSH